MDNDDASKKHASSGAITLSGKKLTIYNMSVPNNNDPTIDDEAEEVVPSKSQAAATPSASASTATSELGKLPYIGFAHANPHICSGPPNCLDQMQFRDPDGHFSQLTSSEKMKLVYRSDSDLGIYGPNNEDVGFDNLPDVLVPGNLVIVDANLF